MEHPTLLMNEMQVFARVVEQQSFAGAARQMGLTTSAVSRSVARLEHQLGIKLLNRTTRSLSLTDAGAEVHAGCLRLMHEAEQLQSLASQHREQPHGLLRISAPAVFGEMWLAPRIPAYCECWPEVQVQLSITDDWVDLVADRIDLAIRIAEPGLITPGLVARPLVPVRYRLVASPAYLEKNAPITEPRDLLAHRFISLGFGQFKNEIELTPNASHTGSATRLLVQTPLTIASSWGIACAATQGLGIGVAADFAVHGVLQTGALVPVLPDWSLTGKYAPRVAHAVYAPTRHVPPKIRALIDHLLDQGGNHLETSNMLIRR